jgi:hypothetical protein
MVSKIHAFRQDLLITISKQHITENAPSGYRYVPKRKGQNLSMRGKAELGTLQAVDPRRSLENRV